MSENTTEVIDNKILHTWEVTVEKEVSETVEQVVNGQPAKVTTKVKKPVSTKMALKRPTRRELRAAELFYGKEFNRFVQMGFLPRSILVNKHLDISGGILSEKERGHAQKLTEKLVSLETDLARAATAVNADEVKKKIQGEIVQIRTELINLNAANESVFSQTAEARAQNQLQNWFTFFLVQIDDNGKWIPYFKGDTFEAKEEHMWSLEEADDTFYNAAADKIATYVYWFNRGADNPEAFRLMDEEMAKQLDAGNKKEEPAAEVVPEAETPPANA